MTFSLLVQITIFLLVQIDKISSTPLYSKKFEGLLSHKPKVDAFVLGFLVSTNTLYVYICFNAFFKKKNCNISNNNSYFQMDKLNIIGKKTLKLSIIFIFLIII